MGAVEPMGAVEASLAPTMHLGIFIFLPLIGSSKLVAVSPPLLRKKPLPIFRQGFLFGVFLSPH